MFRVRQIVQGSPDFQGAVRLHQAGRARSRRTSRYDRKKVFRTGFAVFFVASVITAVLLLANAAHCQPVTTKPQTNSLGVLQYNDNPLMYEAVQTIAEVTEVDGNMNMRVKPVGTYMLYDDIVLLCGMPTEKFNGVTEPFLMTYERRAHHMVRGVACHDLLQVNSIVPNERIK